jgi:hypothetical protein
MMFRLSVLMALVSLSCLVEARAKCGPRAELASPDEFSKYIIKVADYFEGTPRVRVDSLSAAEQSRYAATAKIRCTGLPGTPWAGQPVYATAQLTMKDDLITMAGHSLIYNEPANPPGSGPAICRPLTDPKSCRFLIHSHGADQEISFDHVVENGIKCPTEPKTENDWAVVKLSKHIDDVNYYKVDESESSGLQLGDQVVTIGHSSDFHSKSVYQSGPKHFGQCTILRTYGFDKTTGVSTACGASYGSSGGSLLSSGSDPLLLGVIVDVKESFTEVKHAFDAKIPNQKHWQADGNGTYYVTLQGSFMRALERGANE